MNTDFHNHIFQNMPLAVMVVDRQGQILTINHMASALLNIDASFPAKTDLLSLLGNPGNPEITEFLSLASSQITHIKQFYCKGKILDMTGGPLADPKGTRYGIILTFKDITEIEANRIREKNNEKYAIMGELSADIAHEIRNPLGSIELLASLLRKEGKRKKDINRANQIMAAVKNMENKISSLIQFSKTYQTPVDFVNLHDLLKDILHFSEKVAFRELPFISANYAEVEPIVECNPDMMKQVFLTLILNTLQSLPETSRLDIVTNHLLAQRVIEVHFIEKCIVPQERPHTNMLDRFSHTSDHRWGLGLAIIHNIINMYNGSLRLEYLQTVGTAFVLSFPLADRTGNIAKMTKSPFPKEISA